MVIKKESKGGDEEQGKHKAKNEKGEVAIAPSLNPEFVGEATKSAEEISKDDIRQPLLP